MSVSIQEASAFEESSHFKYGIYTEQEIRESEDTSIPNEVRQAINIEIVKFIRSVCCSITGHSKASCQKIYSSATIYYRRYYICNKLSSTDPKLVAATAIYFASKIESVILSPHTVVDLASNVDLSFHYKIHDIVNMEKQIMCELKKTFFIWHIESYCEELNRTFNMPQFFYEFLCNVVNDSYFTNAALMFDPKTIALGCVTVTGILQNCDIRSIIVSSNELDKVEKVANELFKYYIFIKSKDYPQLQNQAKEYITTHYK